MLFRGTQAPSSGRDYSSRFASDPAGKGDARAVRGFCRRCFGLRWPFVITLLSVISLFAIWAALRWRASVAPRDNSYITHFGYTGPESCARHGFVPREGPPARILDVIMFNREFEMLSLRLAELSSVVDAFIIVESDRTHMGDPKPLHFGPNRERFAPYLDRIVHIVHRNNLTDPRDIEHAQRWLGGGEGLARAGVRDGDLVIVGDVDEVPRASVLETLRQCAGYPANVCLASRSYYLSFEFRHSSDWHYPNVVTWGPGMSAEGLGATPAGPGASRAMSSSSAAGDGAGSRAAAAASAALASAVSYFRGSAAARLLLPSGTLIPPGASAATSRFAAADAAGPLRLRVGDFRVDAGVCIADAGWHCSYCFADAERVLEKMRATIHGPEVATPGALALASDYGALYQEYCEGRDPLHGAWDHFEVQQSLVGLPAAVLADQATFGFLLPGRCHSGVGHVSGTEPRTGVRAWPALASAAGAGAAATSKAAQAASAFWVWFRNGVRWRIVPEVERGPVRAGMA